MNRELKGQIRIRPARLEDATGIARVRVLSWRAAYPGIVPQEILDELSIDDTARVLEGTLRSGAPGRCNLVATDPSGQVVGFALGGPERSQDRQYDGELYAIYILPEFLRIGVGRRLLLALARDLLAHEMQAMLVWVLAENPARKFYEAMGGVFVRAQPISIRQVTLSEVAYGWKDLKALVEWLESSAAS